MCSRREVVLVIKLGIKHYLMCPQRFTAQKKAGAAVLFFQSEYFRSEYSEDFTTYGHFKSETVTFILINHSRKQIHENKHLGGAESVNQNTEKMDRSFTKPSHWSHNCGSWCSIVQGFARQYLHEPLSNVYISQVLGEMQRVEIQWIFHPEIRKCKQNLLTPTFTVDSRFHLINRHLYSSIFKWADDWMFRFWRTIPPRTEKPVGTRLTL